MKGVLWRYAAEPLLFEIWPEADVPLWSDVAQRSDIAPRSADTSEIDP